MFRTQIFLMNIDLKYLFGMDILCTKLQTFVHSFILNGLEFNCTVRDFLCPQHWFLIEFNIIRNCTQTFLGRKLE